MNPIPITLTDAPGSIAYKVVESGGIPASIDGVSPTPTEKITITVNQEGIDVSEYATADVAVVPAVDKVYISIGGGSTVEMTEGEVGWSYTTSDSIAASTAIDVTVTFQGPK